MRARTPGPLVAVAMVVALAGCAGDGETPAESGTGESTEMSGMDEPDATPADEVDGEVRRGAFTVLDTAPPGSDGVTGRAWLTQSDDRTTVTIRLDGLEPDTEYVAHLHARPCAADNGGPHFQFEEGGAEVPPNEVHLGFASSADGAGEATVTNDQRVENGAPAVVVHPADAMDNRLACADFS